jgi:hypothetical protein
MSNKIYLQQRTEYLLQKAIDAEIQRIKDIKKHEPETFDVSHCCTEIGILVALKIQAKDLIEKL